jgi:hypothetical protein
LETKLETKLGTNLLSERKIQMDSATLIRIVAGVVFVVILVVLIQRRRTRTK